MPNFLQFNFWFNMRPGELASATQNLMVIFLVALLAMFLVFGYLKSKKKGIYGRIWERLFNFGLANFLIGLVLMFFAYEMLPILSARIWFLFWFIGMGVWLYFIVRTAMKIPKIKEEKIKEKEFKKYIP